MKALIIGFGQDAKVLILGLKKRNIKFKILTRTSSKLDYFISKYLDKSDVIFGDATDLSSLLFYFNRESFTHVFNVAANSFVQGSKMNFDQFLQSNTRILTNLISLNEKLKSFWLYHPLSSEIFSSKNNENYIQPRNAYGVSKACEYYICKISHDRGLNIFFPILFNHESCFRTGKFFTSKLLQFLNNNNESKELKIWNSRSKRDWGSAFQYMDLIIMSAIDQKIGSGELGTSKCYSVKEFINLSLEIKGISYKYYKKELASWHLEDGRKIYEKERDNGDENRVVLAKKEKVINTFGDCNLLHGKDLIIKLLDEFKAYNFSS